MQCNKIDALDTFHRQVFEEPTKIGIIGSGCSVSTEPTASISHYYNLVQVREERGGEGGKSKNVHEYDWSVEHVLQEV